MHEETLYILYSFFSGFLCPFAKKKIIIKCYLYNLLGPVIEHIII